MALRDDAEELGGILGQINAEINEMKSEMKDFVSYSDQSNTSFSNLISAAEQLKSHQQGSSKLSAEQLKTLNEKVKKEQENLKSLQSSLKVDIESDKISKRAFENQSKGLEDQIQKLLSKQSLNVREEAQLKSLVSAQNKLTKDIEDTNENIKQSEIAYDRVNRAIEDADGSIKKMNQDLDVAQGKAELAERFKGMGKALDQVQTPLSGMLNPLKMINSVIQFVVGGVMDLDKELGETAKSMNMTYEEASKSKLAMVEFAESSKLPLANSENLNKQVVELNKSLGSSVAFENMSKSLQEDVALMGELAVKAGYTADETNAMLKYTMATGQSAEDLMKTGLVTAKTEGMKRGVLLNEKEIMKDVAKASEAVKLSTAGGAEGLVKAAAAAKALGTDLATVDKIAGSLLNFEQSIESELEAELLLGKDLSLEKARQAALNGDLATVSDEIAKNVGSAAEFASMNRAQQEAIAEAVGMNREELAKTLTEQEALKSIGAESVEQAREKYDALVEAHGIEEANKMLGDEALAKQFEQQSLEEKRQEAQKQMQDMLAKEVVPTLANISKHFNQFWESIKGIIQSLGGMKTILVIIGAIIVGKMVKGMIDFGKGVMDGIKLVGTLASKEKIAAIASITKGAWSALGGTPVVGPVLAGAAIAAGIAALMGAFSSGDDVFSPAQSGGGYGKRTLFGPEGAIQLNNKDTVIAGTNLFGNDVMSSPGKSTEFAGKGEIKLAGGGGGNVDMSGMINAVNALRSDINALANRPINVNIDGRKLIEATTGANPNETGDEMRKNSYKVQ